LIQLDLLVPRSRLLLSDGVSVTYFFRFGVWRGVELTRRKVGEVSPTGSYPVNDLKLECDAASPGKRWRFIYSPCPEGNDNPEYAANVTIRTTAGISQRGLKTPDQPS
jgi:hypothetical protein